MYSPAPPFSRGAGELYREERKKEEREGEEGIGIVLRTFSLVFFRFRLGLYFFLFS